MQDLGHAVEEVRVLGDETDELLEQLVLVRVDLAERVDLVFQAHLPTLVQELEELFDLWLGELVKDLVRLEVLDLANNVCALHIELGELLSRVSQATSGDELRECQLELLCSGCCLEVPLVLLILLIVKDVATVRSVLSLQLFPCLGLDEVLDLLVKNLNSLWDVSFEFLGHVACEKAVASHHEEFLVREIVELVNRRNIHCHLWSLSGNDLSILEEIQLPSQTKGTLLFLFLRL